MKLNITFLALLDYVGRAHEIEICPSSVGVRPCRNVSAMSPNLSERISFKFFIVASPGPNTEAMFFFCFCLFVFLLFFLNFFYEYFSSSLTWDPMGDKISLLLHQIAAKSFQTSPEISSQ